MALTYHTQTLIADSGAIITLRIPDMMGYYKDPQTGAEFYDQMPLDVIKDVFEQYEDTIHWKNSFRALVRPEHIKPLLAGIEWYHGKDGILHGTVPEGDHKGWGLIESPGYW